MAQKNDDKGLLNEVLPDPSQADDLKFGSPRERTTRHLRQILAAAAGVGMIASGGARADNSIPPTGKEKPTDKTTPGDKPPTKGEPPHVTEPPAKPPSYWVVDPMPPPTRIIQGPPGFVDIESTPPSSVFVDGTPEGATPIKHLSLDPGQHIIELRLPGQGEAFTIMVKSGKTQVLKKDLRPKKAPPKRHKPK